MIKDMLSFFVDWKVKLAIVLFVLAGLFTYHKVIVHEAVTEAISDIQTQQVKENFKLKERSLNTQIALQEYFDKIQKDKDEKLKSLNSRVASLTLSLQQRPSRAEPSGVSDNPGNEETRQGSTGAELYREDSEFLLREATRAELIKEELLTCYRRYDTAKETLDKFKADNASSKP